jgi:hypothetical protein
VSVTLRRPDGSNGNLVARDGTIADLTQGDKTLRFFADANQITIRVDHADGSLASGIRVDLVEGADAVQGVTDSNGTFRTSFSPGGLR